MFTITVLLLFYFPIFLLISYMIQNFKEYLVRHIISTSIYIKYCSGDKIFILIMNSFTIMAKPNTLYLFS